MIQTSLLAICASVTTVSPQIVHAYRWANSILLYFPILSPTTALTALMRSVLHVISKTNILAILVREISG